MLLTSCHTAVATSATGEVKGRDRQREKLRTSETGFLLSSKFMSSHLSLASLMIHLDWL